MHQLHYVAMLFFAIYLEKMKLVCAESEPGIDALGAKVSDGVAQIPPWAIKLQQGFKVLKTEVKGVMEEQQRLNEQQQRIADSQTMQAKLDKAIERSALITQEETSKSAIVQRWQHHETQHRHMRHRTGEPALHDASNYTNGASSSCPKLRTGHVIYLEPAYFSFGYYVDISILDDTGRKVRVGHVNAAVFNWHSKLYLTDANGKVRRRE
jgi:hypothetical protein